MTNTTAKEEITTFLQSKEAGMVSSFSAATIQKAAESMFTANGLNCPIDIRSLNGSTVVINRAIYANGAQALADES